MSSHIASGVCSRQPMTQVIYTVHCTIKAPVLDPITQVWGLQAAAFVPGPQPLSHRARTVVIVVMVAMLGVCNLQTGLPLWLFAISCV